jgi:hypothetical protein
MTGTRDAAWSALVTWTMDTLIAADLAPQSWAAGGVESLPIEAPELGLEHGWQQRVVAAVAATRRYAAATSARRQADGRRQCTLARGRGTPGAAR